MYVFIYIFMLLILFKNCIHQAFTQLKNPQNAIIKLLYNGKKTLNAT